MEEWKSQIKRGTLAFCVLLMIARRERYGYEIISELEKRPSLTARSGGPFWRPRRARSIPCCAGC